MKKVIVRGFLYMDTGAREPLYFHSTSRDAFTASRYVKLVMPLNFEAEVPDADALTPISVLADEAEFARLRAGLVNAEMLDCLKAFHHIAMVYPGIAQLMVEAGGPLLLAAEHVIAKAEARTTPRKLA